MTHHVPTMSDAVGFGRTTHDSQLPHPQMLAASRTSGSTGWTVQFLWYTGIIGFLVGGVLLATSFHTDRVELWRVGMPTILVSQVAILLALIFQLTGIGRVGATTAERLEKVEEQVCQFRREARILGTTHGSSSQAFYGHFVEGANPTLLLADVKGQLDLLASRLAEDRRSLSY